MPNLFNKIRMQKLDKKLSDQQDAGPTKKMGGFLRDESAPGKEDLGGFGWVLLVFL